MDAPTSTAPINSDDEFVDARENLSTPSMSKQNSVIFPYTFSRIEPLAPNVVPADSELSLVKLAKEILTSVKPGGDVTHINLPASILDPVSTLEKTKKSMQRGELLQDICAARDPVSRFLKVVCFNLSGLARERFGKKPYNPVLGEVYRCCYPHSEGGGDTLLIAEQVSHHPPISALHLRNDTLGFSMNSYTAPEPRFWGNSLVVRLSGEIRIELAKFEEVYVITRPCLYMSGFMVGSQRLEFNGTSSFSCEKSGLGAEIDFKAKGALAIRAEPNGVIGRIFKLATDETLFTLEGHWDKKVILTDAKTKESRVLFDYEKVVAEKSMVAVLPPEEEEEESFSTKVWAYCSKAIFNGESASANAEKRKVEENQRQLKKEREAANVEWSYRYFVKRLDWPNGYDLKPELKSRTAVLSLSESELQDLRSGETVHRMLNETTGENGSANGDDGNKFGLRRKLMMSRPGRGKA